MPPAMASVRGPLRVQTGSVGTAPRREPLRRLYPLQRTSRSHSESGPRDINNKAEESNPFPINFDPETLKRRVHKTISTAALSPRGSRRERTITRFESPDRYIDRRDRQVHSHPPLLRRGSDVGSLNSSFNSTLQRPHFRDDSSMVSGKSKGVILLNRSILKRPNSSSKKLREHLSSPKSVQFCPNVSVVHMDEDGEHILTHFQELNGEKRKRLGTLTKLPQNRDYDNIMFINDNNENQSDNSYGIYESLGPDTKPLMSGRTQRDSAKRQGSTGSTSQNMTHEHSQENVPFLNKGHFNISFTSRTGEGTKLRFVLHMGQEYNPNDLVVKANTNGSRLRVLATKNGGSAGAREYFSERYQLPMEIDPYEIEARLDKWGNLTVEAPLATLDKRIDIHKVPTNTAPAIYV